MQPPKTTTLLNIKALYFFYFGAFGIIVVFLNIYYREIGLSGLQIGSINGVAPLVAIAGGPLWGVLNDRLSRPRLMMLLTAAGMALAVLGISTARTVAALLPLVGAYALFNSAMVPMIDTFNLSALGNDTQQYGRQRIWGTVGFILVTWTAGFVLERTGTFGMFYIYYFMVVGLALTALFLPSRAVGPRGTGGLRLGALARQRRLLIFLASMALINTAANAMNTFLPIYLNDMGASKSLVGSVSSLNALSEVPIMLFSALLLNRVGTKRMLVTAYCVYAVRMLLYGLIPAPEWALPVSLLHGLTFGLSWVAAVVHVNRMAPEGMKNTSQALMFASINVANMTGSFVGGWLYDALGPAWLFRVEAGVCLLALAVLLWGWGQENAPQPD